jgi:hypothetical protein
MEMSILTVFTTINQSSGYDVYRRGAVLCIVVAMTSIDVMHISNLYVRGIYVPLWER